MRNAKSPRRRKGMYEVVEEVLLFGVGLTIMIGLVGVFNFFENKMLDTLAESQIDAANKYVASAAITLAATNCTRCYMTVEIPPLIGGKSYTISGNSFGTISAYAQGTSMFEENITVPAAGQVDGKYASLQVEYSSSPSGRIRIRGVSNY